jgi:hypothetical protein
MENEQVVLSWLAPEKKFIMRTISFQLSFSLLLKHTTFDDS